MAKLNGFLFCLFSAFFIQLSNAGVHQKKLLEKLFKNYDPSERPVADDNDYMNVTIGLSIQQIVDVDEKKQTIVFSGWLDMGWFDYSFKWNPEDFGNISSIRVTSSKIWIPDLLLYNSADDSFDPKVNVNAVIYNTGEVSFLPPGMFKSTCQIEINQFPFDEQFCQLKFGSWTYDDSTVNLLNKSDSAQLDSYIQNGEWFLENVNSYSESLKYECCPQKFPFVMFTLHIRRRTLYFIFNLVFPCVLISFMSVLGFFLPPDSGEKIGLEITTLLSIIMFSQLITAIVPESSLSVPKIAVYFASVMVICTLSIIANVIVLVFHHKNVKIQKPMPKWVETWICGHLARLLRMENPSKDSSKKSPKKIYSESATSNIDLNDLSSKSLLANVLDINDDFGVLSNRHQNGKFKTSQMIGYHSNPVFLKRENSSNSQSNCLDGAEDSFFDSSKSEIHSLRKSLHLIFKEIKYLTSKVKDDEEDEEKALDWKFAAMVIDRLCMIFFAGATLLSTILILLTAKNFFKLK